ncbi:hypothetical protein D7X55_13175 [Corallococcus sp. AB049A]|uniref:Uncharacterized protein n=1 Tax=Corallococcus interemptor TaxID=2316720 RepID=A0A3A8R3G8_9BACT|nr:MULTISPECIES: hypothetical protein [Corallococcus]RKH43388.1 hypothetical protein D7Y23_29400 [Corallococcus sp. AB050B]RKH73345.1 hypothetical protein D7X96_02815 [Corallococcus interemptor]RKI67782.1 hypothetical protein D7X55_13175 [Corallococcus sp. AB049A]
MNRSILLKSAWCALLVPLLSCNLLKVTDDEGSTTGRGAKRFDPYQGLNSGAVRLSLQYINGCAFLPNGQMVAKNGVNVPYPDVCITPLAQNPLTLSPPQGTMQILSDTQYFLNQFSVSETVVNQHNNPNDQTAALAWIKNQSVFAGLDWTNVNQGPDEWSFYSLAGAVEDCWTREVQFGNANWQKVKDDTITVEVLDETGTPRASQTYQRSELLASSPYAGHSRFSWRSENLKPPRFPGDKDPGTVTGFAGGLDQSPITRTIARVDMVGSTNPFKVLRVPRLSGPGALRATWSQLPDKPFYFPVTYVIPDERPSSCTDDAGNPVQCNPGLDSRLVFAPPKEGSFYKPGEDVSVYVDLRDSAGAHLHSRDLLPSAREIIGGQSNGLITFIPNVIATVTENDSISNVAIAGPLQDLQVLGNPSDKPQFFAKPFPFATLDDATLTGLTPGLIDYKWPTRQTFTLPANAKPGTYVALVKFNRASMGERVAKLNPFFFQVGQDEPTTYPGNVGNCQICHRGVLSLDNLRHGLSVDHIESCKVCHHYDTDTVGRTQEMVHRIHMNSPSYPANRADCTVCHLTRKSTERPSLALCGSCHISQHGDEFFQIAFNQRGTPSKFGNCAQTCHGGDQLPASHILPAK